MMFIKGIYTIHIYRVIENIFEMQEYDTAELYC